jgi:uncharacterized repeat protein (TIGR01451 family)
VTGNVAAEDVRVQLHWPTAANLVDVSAPAMRNEQGNQQAEKSDKEKSSESQNGPTPAKDKSAKSDGKSQSEDQQSDRQSETSMEMSERVLVIDRLEAGQTATFDYAVRAGDLDKLPTKIVATYVCTVDPAEDQAKSTARTQSTAMATAKVVRLPAMQMMVIDDEDPVIKGDQVVYTIRVWNEGDAPDSNVRLQAELPAGLEFVSADGPTKNSQDGSTIAFEPIKTMEPGDRADYKVTAKGTGDEAVRFQANLTSKHLPSQVSAEEPTRLFKR